MAFDMNQDFSAVSSERLVDDALENVLQIKPVAAELERRPPSGEAANHVIRTFREGRAQPWLAALLLGRIGHENGYATAREILLGEPGAGSYAAAALARIRGERAINDLCEALVVAPMQADREGAASALSDLGPGAAGPVMSASIDGHIRWQTAAGILAHLLIDPIVVAELLASRHERGPKMGTEILWRVLPFGRSSDADRWLERAGGLLIEPLRRILAAPTVNMAPRKRKGLEAWVSRVTRG
jgi:hypothetical protein